MSYSLLIFLLGADIRIEAFPSMRECEIRKSEIYAEVGRRATYNYAICCCWFSSINHYCWHRKRAIQLRNNMAHYAFIDQNNIVIEVIVGKNEISNTINIV